MAASGPSGAGRALKPHLLGSELMGSASAYGVGGVHRHTPETRCRTSAPAEPPRPSVSFTPVLVPMSRGILATCTAPLADPAHRLSRRRTPRTPRLRRRAVRPPAPAGQWPQTQSVLGSNAVHVQVAVDRGAGRLVAVAALDNLTKGTAGGAIQCMNLALGMPGDHRPVHRRGGAVTRLGTDPAPGAARHGSARRRTPRCRAGRWTTTTSRRSGASPGPRTSSACICAYEAMPGTVTGVGPFVAFSIDGPLDHSLIGVLAGLLEPLAQAGISILAESTFDTDWILVPAAQADQAVEVWTAAGHLIDIEERAVSVTGAAGFVAAGTTAGLKASGQTDLALVVNTGPDYAAAGVFTSNRVKAAPVLWSQQVLADGRLQAVILNSGGANACTGPDGFADTHRTAELVARCRRSADRRHRRRRLLDRPDRRAAADGQDRVGHRRPGADGSVADGGGGRGRRS